MPLSSEIMRRLKTPCVVLKPFQAKVGYRLPNDLPVVVDGANHDRDKLLRWLHMFVTLATLNRRANAPVYVVWFDDIEEIDLETCPRYEMRESS